MIRRRDVYSATIYCIQHDLRDYIPCFIDRVPADIILVEAAKLQNTYFADLAVKHGASQFDHAMLAAIDTEDMAWVTYFKNLGGTNYKACIIAAMQVDNDDLINLIWGWDEKNTIDEKALIDTISDCLDPVNIINILDDLGVDFDIPILIGHGVRLEEFDHETQLEVINELMDRGYTHYPNWLHDIVATGNIKAVHMFNDWGGLDYPHVLNVAAENNQTDIMRLARYWENFDEKGYTSVLKSALYANSNPEVIQLLLTWGANINLLKLDLRFNIVNKDFSEDIKNILSQTWPLADHSIDPKLLINK